MKIHTKLVGFVVGALVVPFLLGMFYVRHFGKLYYQNQQGIFHLMIAEELAATLQAGVQQKFQQMLTWAAVSPLHSFAAKGTDPQFDMDAVRRMDLDWTASMQTNAGPGAVLSNPLSKYLRAFQRVNPEFAEMLMTDAHGRLIGATSPTTDYWQGDESWWKTAADLPAGNGEIPGLLFDESAGILAIDMVFPVHSFADPSEFLGVLKVSLHATRFLRRVAPRPWNKEIARDLVLPDGRVLAHINAGDAPAYSQIAQDVFQQLRTANGSWKTVELVPGTRSLAAAAPVHILKDFIPFGDEQDHLCELYVVVSRDLNKTMAPVQAMLRQLTLWEFATALLFAVLSYLLTTYWFARPIKKLRNASVSLVDYIKLSEQGRFEDTWASRQEARRKLSELETLRSRDELQDLSRDFIRMGEQMLSFLRRIEDKLHETKRK